MYDNGSSAGVAGTAGVLAFTGTDVGLYLSVILVLVAAGLFLVGLRKRTRTRAARHINQED